MPATAWLRDSELANARAEALRLTERLLTIRNAVDPVAGDTVDAVKGLVSNRNDLHRACDGYTAEIGAIYRVLRRPDAHTALDAATLTRRDLDAATEALADIQARATKAAGK